MEYTFTEAIHLLLVIGSPLVALAGLYGLVRAGFWLYDREQRLASPHGRK